MTARSLKLFSPLLFLVHIFPLSAYVPLLWSEYYAAPLALDVFDHQYHPTSALLSARYFDVAVTGYASCVDQLSTSLNIRSHYPISTNFYCECSVPFASKRVLPNNMLFPQQRSGLLYVAPVLGYCLVNNNRCVLDVFTECAVIEPMSKVLALSAQFGLGLNVKITPSFALLGQASLGPYVFGQKDRSVDTRRSFFGQELLSFEHQIELAGIFSDLMLGLAYRGRSFFADIFCATTWILQNNTAIRTLMQHAHNLPPEILNDLKKRIKKQHSKAEFMWGKFQTDFGWRVVTKRGIWYVSCGLYASLFRDSIWPVLPLPGVCFKTGFAF